MFIEERHQEIIKHIKENGRISIGEIQELFSVSVDSARRDLRILEEKGLLKRTHGGAIPIQKVGVKPPDKWTVRDIEQINPYYDAVARKACTFISENDIIYITSASVGYLMIKYLPTDIEFTVVTNSILIADELKAVDNISVYMLGGRLRSRGTCVDAMAAETIEKLHMDINFMTGAGFSANFGLTNGSPETAAFQNAVIKNSRKNIVLAPNLKIGFNGFIKVADASCFDMLITDWETVKEELNAIRELGVEIIIAEK